MQGDSADRFAVRELIDRYSDALSRRDFAAMAGLFQADATWSAGSPFDLRLFGTEIVPMIADMVSPYAFLLQMTLGSVIEVTGDRADARTTIRELALSADGAAGLDSYGFYHDALERTDAGWRFRTRRFEPVYLDTRRLEGLALRTLTGTA
jgi:hypothetical protein